jgi:hypothetical protein
MRENFTSSFNVLSTWLGMTKFEDLTLTLQVPLPPVESMQITSGVTEAP